MYFGDQNGTAFSLRASDGHVNWKYAAKGAVKGGPALAYGRLYFGDYAGRAYALDPLTGRQIWAVTTSGADFGFGSGNFYSTPAVAFGRVYMGNTDGRVYSFGARTGALAWATSTGAYVYASPAVADVPGIGPTVYEGSYDGSFYAFNAGRGDPLAPPGRRPDLGLSDDRRLDRVLLEPRRQEHDRTERGHR